MTPAELAHSLVLDLYAQLLALKAENNALREQLAAQADEEPAS